MNGMIEFIAGSSGTVRCRKSKCSNVRADSCRFAPRTVRSWIRYSLYAENEKFRKRNKEMERQIEDLLSENQRLKRGFKNADDSMDDLRDNLSRYQREVSKLRLQNDELCRNIQEYKEACDHYKMEIENLKSKLG